MSEINVGDFLVSVWNNYNDFVPEKKKDDSAVKLIELFISHELIDVDDIEVLEDAYGCDEHLDSAIASTIKEYKQPSIVEDEELDYNFED